MSETKRNTADACPACPCTVRGLAAVVHNMLTLLSDPERFLRKFPERCMELQGALDAIQPELDAHFENPDHAHCSALDAVRGHWPEPPSRDSQEQAFTKASKVIEVLRCQWPETR